MLFDACDHKICFLYVIRLHLLQHLFFPEVLLFRNKILFCLQVSLQGTYKELLCIVPVKTGNIGLINVHDGHIVPYLVLIVDRDCIICPFFLTVVVGCLTLQDSIRTICKFDEKVHVCKHKAIQRMSEHRAHWKNLKSCLLRKDFCYQIFQSVSYFLCYPVILILLKSRTDTCFVVKEISFGCKRGNSHDCCSITATDSFLSVI